MTSSFLEKFVLRHNDLRQTWNRRQKSKPHQSYLRAVRALTEVIGDVSTSGSFEEGLAVLKEGHFHDMGLLATTHQEEKNFLESMESLQIGEVHYSTLRDFPDVYRDRLAAGFQKKDRFGPEKVVPKDGMHKALTSYAQHLTARHSPLIAGEEKDLLSAMIKLTVIMAAQYYSMQRKTLGLTENNG